MPCTDVRDGALPSHWHDLRHGLLHRQLLNPLHAIVWLGAARLNRRSLSLALLLCGAPGGLDDALAGTLNAVTLNAVTLNAVELPDRILAATL